MTRGKAALVVAALASACGPSANQRSCSQEQWQGRCQVTAVTKVQEKEFPVPHVVIEAVYTPQENPQYRSFTPPETREYYKVLASQEPAVRDHVQKNAVVDCHLKPPPPNECMPGTIALALPPFDAMAATSQTDTTPKPSGCARIESQATQDQMSKLGATTTQIPEEIQFERGSAEPPADIATVANQLAQKIRSNAKLECVAVVGQVAPGESPGLADQRARAIKNLLLENGVDPARLVIITATVPVFGSGSAPPPDDPEKRRVRLRVLLESNATPAP